MPLMVANVKKKSTRECAKSSMEVYYSIKLNIAGEIVFATMRDRAMKEFITKIIEQVLNNWTYREITMKVIL